MGKSAFMAALALAVACMATQASGQFMPMSFGFPNIVHSVASTAWEHDTMDAFSYDDFDVGFPGAGLWGIGMAFPSIHQTSIRALSMSHTEFSQTTEFTAIGYPYVSVGPGGFICG